MKIDPWKLDNWSNSKVEGWILIVQNFVTENVDTQKKDRNENKTKTETDVPMQKKLDLFAKQINPLNFIICINLDIRKKPVRNFFWSFLFFYYFLGFNFNIRRLFPRSMVRRIHS